MLKEEREKELTDIFGRLKAYLFRLPDSFLTMEAENDRLWHLWKPTEARCEVS
jgi:hypothetical protein